MEKENENSDLIDQDFMLTMVNIGSESLFFTALFGSKNDLRSCRRPRSGLRDAAIPTREK